MKNGKAQEIVEMIGESVTTPRPITRLECPVVDCELVENEETGETTSELSYRLPNGKAATLEHFKELFGTDSWPLAKWLVNDFGRGIPKHGITAATIKTQVNGQVAFVHEMQPNDVAEAALLIQMGMIHAAMGRVMGDTCGSDRWQAYSELNKLARTYATMLEALKRYRSKGMQRIRVERVNISEGGQAVVGDVYRQGGGGHGRKSI